MLFSGAAIYLLISDNPMKSMRGLGENECRKERAADCFGNDSCYYRRVAISLQRLVFAHLVDVNPLRFVRWSGGPSVMACFVA